MSGHEHLSEDALLDAIYGIAGSETHAHLGECPKCVQRLEEWHSKRAAIAETVVVSSEVLAAQRRKIYERIEHPSRKRWLWAPGLAAASALAIGAFIYHPAEQRSLDKRAEVSDTQLFGDVYSMEQSMEPAAAAPRAPYLRSNSEEPRQRCLSGFWRQLCYPRWSPRRGSGRVQRGGKAVVEQSAGEESRFERGSAKGDSAYGE